MKSEYTFVDMYVSAHATGSRLFTHQNQMVVASTGDRRTIFLLVYRHTYVICRPTIFTMEPKKFWSRIYIFVKIRFRGMFSGFQLFSRLVSRSPHTNNQYQSWILATIFCLLTLLVNIGKIKVLNWDQNTSKNANTTLYTKRNKNT